jgi:RimJ/RimL family protein N-acetyltransferase
VSSAVPPYRIETERLVVRCWDPGEAPLLKEAIDESLEHLRPWMSWAQDEPQPLDQKVELLRRFRGQFDRGQFDLGEEFVYGIFDMDESNVVGGTGLHRRVGDDAFEIGYWIRTGRTREGLATEVTAALTRVAFEVCGVDRVEICVDPANTASAGIPRKLGYREEATLRRRLPWSDGSDRRDVVVFTLFADELASTPCAEVAVAAFDAVGERLL